MSVAFTELAFVESTAETTSLEVRYRDGSSGGSAYLSHVQQADLHEHGIMAIIDNDRYFIPWSSVVYVHQGGAPA